MNSPTLLVVEDEIDLRDIMVSYLNLEGFFAVGVGSLAQANQWLDAHQADVIVLDLNLGEEDGIVWLENAALPETTSVVIASARGEVVDRVKGFELGIDAYLVKPVALEELTAIVRNIQAKKELHTKTYDTDWVLETLEWTLFYHPLDQALKLTQMELLLLKRLAETPGEAVSKNDLIVAMNKSLDSYDYRSLEVLVRRLRNKIDVFSEQQRQPISTVHSVGYAFVESIRLK